MAKIFTVGKKMRISPLVFSLIATLTLTQCVSYDFARRIHQQGNLLEQPQLDRLKVGMSKEDVAILLGNSMLSPTFTDDRWDYAYTWRRGTGFIEKRHLVLYFKQGTLVQMERKP